METVWECCGSVSPRHSPFCVHGVILRADQLVRDNQPRRDVILSPAGREALQRSLDGRAD